MACSWDELWKKVSEAEDLDHIVAAHGVFLDAIIKGSLLNEESQPLLTQLRAIFDLIIQFQSVQESLYSDSCEELRQREKDRQAIKARTGQGEWGLTAQMEQDQKRRKTKFLREFIPTSRAQLKVLRKSYQDMVQRFLVMLTGHSDDSLRLLAVRLDFNEVYKAKEPMLRSPITYNRTKKVF